MAHPESLLDYVKYLVWWLYTPLHPYVRDMSLMFGIVEHEGRQNYLLGKLHPERRLQDLAQHLVTHGYGNHFVAWEDTDEILSLRRVDGFRRQYHIRIFGDGEVRGHYEYTPEYRPLQHLFQVGFEDRSEEFIKMLDGWIVPCTGV